MITYNDIRFTYNWDYTYNWVQLSNIFETQSVLDDKKNNINSYYNDISTPSDSVSTIRVMVINVDDTSTSSENKIFNISTYLTEIQSLTDNSLNKIELTKQETISSNDSKLIDILSNNVDIIYTTDSGWVSSLLFKKTKPWVVWLDRITPLILKAIKHKPLVQ